MSSWQNSYWHPHVYIPPFNTPGTRYSDLPGISPHHFGNVSAGAPMRFNSHASRTAEGFHSRKYPTLNPLLAADTLVSFDVRNKPQDAILTSTFHSSRLAPATAVPVTSMRLLSRSFPWTIDIVSMPGVPITCEAIWQAIHAALQEPLADSEWGLAICDWKQRDTIEKAAKRRQEQGDREKKLKRIDWLGDGTMFKGLDKDDDFARLRLLPGSDACAETWMVKFGTR